MQIAALPLNYIRRTTLMSDFPRSANRERADYEISVLDYRFAPDRFFAFHDSTADSVCVFGGKKHIAQRT